VERVAREAVYSRFEPAQVVGFWSLPTTLGPPGYRPQVATARRHRDDGVRLVELVVDLRRCSLGVALEPDGFGRPRLRFVVVIWQTADSLSQRDGPGLSTTSAFQRRALHQLGRSRSAYRSPQETGPLDTPPGPRIGWAAAVR